LALSVKPKVRTVTSKALSPQEYFHLILSSASVPGAQSESPSWGLVTHALEALSRRIAKVGEGLGRFRFDKSRVKSGLRTKAELTTGLEGKMQDALEGLRALTSAQDAASFLKSAQSLYPRPHLLQESLRMVESLEQALPMAHELSSALTYLQGAEVDQREPELLADKTALQQEMRLSSLLENPQSWPTAQWAFDWFKARYAEAYLKHHDTVHQQGRLAASALREAAPYARALENLNTVGELGPPIAEGLLEKFQRLQQVPGPCPQTLSLSDVKAQPRCPLCHLSLTEGSLAPSDGESLAQQLRQALRDRCRRLTSVMAGKFVAQRQPRVERLLKIAQASDLSAFALALDDQVTAFLRGFLQGTQAQRAEPSPSRQGRRRGK
jgi:hypothetical protein